MADGAVARAMYHQLASETDRWRSLAYILAGELQRATKTDTHTMDIEHLIEWAQDRWEETTNGTFPR